MKSKSYKIMLLGSMSVGKTSIANRMKFNTFDVDHKSTIGVQLYSFKIELHGESTEIVLWDTDGEFGNKILESVYVKGSDAAIVVSDAAREKTVQSMLQLCEDSDADIVEYKRRCSEIRQCSAKDNDGVMESIVHVASLVSTTAT